MIIDGQTSDLAFRGFNTICSDAFSQAGTHCDRIAMTVPGSSRDESGCRIGQFPQLRERIGPRHARSLAAHGFTITGKTFESTVAIRRTDVEDDRPGIFRPMVAGTGTFARRHPEELVSGLLKDGFTAPCLDGSGFFADDHEPEVGGEKVEVGNVQDGPGPAWFLPDTSRALGPDHLAGAGRIRLPVDHGGQ